MDTSRTPTTFTAGTQPPGADAATRLDRPVTAPGSRPTSARDVAESAKQSAAQASEQISRTARDAADQATSALKQQADNVSRQVREQGGAVIQQQKERAAAVADDVAGALRRAAEKLRQEQDQNLAGYTEALADGAGSVGRYLRETEPRAMADHAADCARRHPEWVLGGAYVVGLAVARFLKASRPDGAAYGSYRRDRPPEASSAPDAAFGTTPVSGTSAGTGSSTGSEAAVVISGGAVAAVPVTNRLPEVH